MKLRALAFLFPVLLATAASLSGQTIGFQIPESECAVVELFPGAARIGGEHGEQARGSTRARAEHEGLADGRAGAVNVAQRFSAGSLSPPAEADISRTSIQMLDARGRRRTTSLRSGGPPEGVPRRGSLHGTRIAVRTPILVAGTAGLYPGSARRVARPESEGPVSPRTGDTP